MLNRKQPFLHMTITLHIILLALLIIPFSAKTAHAFNLSAEAPTASTEKPYLGNVNSDHTINVGDAITILRHIVGLTDLDTDLRQRADVNLDGEITVSDAIMVLRYIVGLTTEFTTADPAIVSTEQALNHVIYKTTAETVILTENIILTEDLNINRNITVKGPENKEIKTIQGTVNIVAETTAFNAQNLIVEGTITVNAGGEILIDLSHNCDIYQAVFLSGEVYVTGGKNIRSAWIAAHATVEFDTTPPIEEAISTEKSYLQKTTPQTVTAGEDNIEILITLKDFTDSPLSDHFNVTVKHDSEIWFGEEELYFDEEGKALLTLTVIKAGQYNAVAVKVKDITMGTFDITVEPAGIDGENSAINYSDKVTAGEDNITLEIKLQDKYENSLTGKYSTVLEIGERTIIDPYLHYPADAPARINLTETKAATHTVTVTVENTIIGEFTVIIEPAETAKLAVTREPSGSSDGSGKTGKVLIVTRDRWGNDTVSGLGEDVYIEATPTDGKFSGDSLPHRKNIGTGGDSPGEVEFSNLQIETETNLFDQTMVFYSLAPEFEELKVTTQPFHIIGFAAISGEISLLEKTTPAIVTAHEKNISLKLTLYDPNDNPLTGTFLITVGEDWFKEPVQFVSGHINTPDGQTELILDQTAAGEYTEIPVIADNTEIGTFDITVEPAVPEKIEFAGDSEEEIIIVAAKTPLDITVIARDIYDNPTPGEEIYVYCLYDKEGIIIEPEERAFDSGTLSQTTDNFGKAEFHDLVINETGNYIILFTFHEIDVENIEEKPPLFQNFLIIPHPEESLTYWDGYNAPLQSEINRPEQILAIPRDANGYMITGLQKTDFTLEAHYRENELSAGYPNSETVRGTLTLEDFAEVFPGLYEIEFRYTEEAYEPMFIELTVSFRGTPLDKKIPVNFQP